MAELGGKQGGLQIALTADLFVFGNDFLLPSTWDDNQLISPFKSDCYPCVGNLHEFDLRAFLFSLPSCVMRSYILMQQILQDLA